MSEEARGCFVLKWRGYMPRILLENKCVYLQTSELVYVHGNASKMINSII